VGPIRPRRSTRIWHPRQVTPFVKPEANDTLPAVFTHRQAEAMGVRPERPHGLTLCRVTRGIYTDRAPVDFRLRVRAACLALGDDSVVHGVTALRLWGADLPQRLADDDTIHVLRRERTFPTVRTDVCAHRDQLQFAPRRLNGLPVTHPAEAWLQVARLLNVDDLVHVADGLMRRQSPLTTRAILERAVTESRRRPGIRTARAALDLARERTDSWTETSTRLILVRAGLPCPVVNLPVLDDDGWARYLLDMAYEEQRIGIEYDGAGHVLDRTIMERDRTRRRWLEDRGWRLIPVTAADLRNPAPLIASVRQALTVTTRS